MTTTPQIETHRRRPLRIARRLSGDVKELEGEAAHGLGGESGGGLSDLPTHMDDLGSARHEEEMDLAFLAKEEGLLDECNAALARIDAGTFGRCEDCGRPIVRKRLQACPFARRCIGCAREREARQER